MSDERDWSIRAVPQDAVTASLMDQMEAEIYRLRAEVEKLTSNIPHWHYCAVVAEAEVARLTKERDKFFAAFDRLAANTAIGFYIDHNADILFSMTNEWKGKREDGDE